MNFTKWISILTLAGVFTCSDVRDKFPQEHLGLPIRLYGEEWVQGQFFTCKCESESGVSLAHSLTWFPSPFLYLSKPFRFSRSLSGESHRGLSPPSPALFSTLKPYRVLRRQCVFLLVQALPIFWPTSWPCPGTGTWCEPQVSVSLGDVLSRWSKQQCTSFLDLTL